MLLETSVLTVKEERCKYGIEGSKRESCDVRVYLYLQTDDRKREIDRMMMEGRKADTYMDLEVMMPQKQ